MKVDAIGKKHRGKNIIFIYPDAGLGNRLNCIYSGLYWQKRMGIRMKILWEVDLACGIEYEKLFSPMQDVSIKTVYTLPIKRTGVRSVKGKLYITYLKHSVHYLTSRETRRQFADNGEMAIERILRDNKRHCIKSNSFFADQKHIAEVIDFLKPSAEVENRVNEIMKPYENDQTIGIHIRRTDHALAIQNSPISIFTDQMKRLMKETPNVKFYLATDDQAVEREISEDFPLIKHKSFSKEKNRTTETGMMDAYVDMLCLSRCDKIYGSYQSTFSRMASLIGKKECIVLQKSTEKA